MIKKIIFSVLSILLVGCMGVTSVKSIGNIDLKSTGNRVKKTILGPTIIFSSISLGDSIDSKEGLIELQRVSQCKDLKNIDIEFFNYNIIVIGYQKMILQADCVRE
jgi:hypothetical protein